MVFKVTAIVDEFGLEAADTGATSEGLVAITPVDEMYWIKENQPVFEDEFNCLEVSRDQTKRDFDIYT